MTGLTSQPHNLTPRAQKDLDALPVHERDRVARKLFALQNGLTGDIKHLRQTFPDYRLRVGDYRALFAIETTALVVYRVRHRREAYR
jgi:mRNA interferase RelE/StbE